MLWTNPKATLTTVEQLKQANAVERGAARQGAEEQVSMIEKIIEFSIRNRFLVLIVTAALTVAGVFAMLNTPVDAIPDLSENQVIVFTDWMGRSPREIEDQVTYPLSRKLQGLAGVRAVRSSSEFNFSMITIIFDDNIDFYFARQRVTEKLAQANTFLPAGVVPYLAPDATALGQIFWYTVEAEPREQGRSRTAVGAEQVLHRAATQRGAGRGRRGHRRRHAAGISDRRAARGAAGLWHHAGRSVRGGRQEQHAGRRRRHSEEQRRVHRPRRRLDEGQGGHRRHGHQRGRRHADLRPHGGQRVSWARSSAAASTKKTATK